MGIRGSYINYNEEFKEQDFFDELEFYKERYNIIINASRMTNFKETLSYGAHYAEKLDAKIKEKEELDRKQKIDDLGKGQYESTEIADAQYKLKDAKDEKKDAEKDEKEAERNIKEARRERWSARMERHEAFTALSSISIFNISEKFKAHRKLRQSNRKVKALKFKIQQAKDKKTHVYRRQVRADREIERANQNLEAKKQEHTQFMDKYITIQDKITKYTNNVNNAKTQKDTFKNNIQADIQIYINARCLNNFLYQHKSTYGDQLAGIQFLVDYLDFCQKHTNKNGKVTIEIGDPQNKADINYLKNLTANYEKPLFNRYPNSPRAKALNQAKLSFQNNLDQEKADYIKDMRDYEGR